MNFHKLKSKKENNMKKTLSIWIIVVITALTVVACSDHKSDNNSNPQISGTVKVSGESNQGSAQ